jgi:hypothetical protein
MSMLLALLFTCLAFFRSRWVRTFYVRLMLSSPNACLIIARVSVPLFPKFAQNLITLAVALSDPLRNRIRPDMYVINQHVHPAAWNFVCWRPRYASINLSLHHATTTAVQMAAPVPKIMDILSYIYIYIYIYIYTLLLTESWLAWLH